MSSKVTPLAKFKTSDKRGPPQGSVELYLSEKVKKMAIGHSNCSAFEIWPQDLTLQSYTSIAVSISLLPM